MKSAGRGKRISAVGATNVSIHGFWLLIGHRELFLPFEQFPWFKDASIGQVQNVRLLKGHHLYWPELDIDLDSKSIEHPEQFPLVSRALQGRRLHSPIFSSLFHTA